MSFQLTRTHTTVVLAATTIAASLVVIPSLAEGNHATEDPFCASLTGADARITAEYNPLLAQYADAAAGNSAGNKADPEREAQLRKDLADAQAALEAAKQDAEKPSPSVSDAPAVGDAPAADTTVDRGLDWVDWSKVDYETQAKIIEALIVQKMNAYRANVGLPELVVSDTVTGDARSWSKHMSDTDSFEHDQSYKNMGQGALDGADTMSAAENIAYNHLENFSAGGGMKTPAQAAADLFDQWKNSKGHDRNMLGASNTVGVGVYIAKGSEGTRVYGTQKFYGVTGGSPNLSRFHTTGDTASAYGFDGKAFNTDNTNYVSGLAGSGDEQRANSWEKMVGALPGSALPVDVSTLPAKNGAAAPATPAPAPATPAPVDDKPSVDADKAVADAQAAVDAAQKALDDYLASISEDKPAVDLEELDAQLDKVADSIAADTSVRPEKDGGVTVLEGDNKAERYLTAEEYRAALTNCTAAEIPNPSIGEPSAPAPGPSTPTTPEPSAPAPGPSTPTTTAPVVPAPAPSQPSTPSKTRPQTIASTGTTATWVAVGAVAVLVAGIGALIASRRAKN
ncbi:CAP domain-containing protein [Actinomyces sp. ICM47]|jgi:putative LPXTG-motif protein cell wall anchor domain protein|uniref:CAP domain-containing protein n=1 Tax=Actinomyces sp. ICM47 TaxID=936548 RepID=UPI0025C02DFF|nr:CAP domain-containing protein [Actinomyces sp. ICM47]